MLSVSVVTPSLNQARFIERTVRSVLDQRYAPLEYVICDGGSSDDTQSVLDQFDGQLKLIREPDRGQADAVNKGIRATSHDVIGWLNSDDVYFPGTLAAISELLTAQPSVDVVYGDAQLLDAQDRPLGAYYTEPWNPARLAVRCYLCQPAVFFRRRVVEQFGFLDESLHYCMDYEYWLRLAAAGAVFAYAPILLAGSRLHPETKTLSARHALHQEINAMLRARLGRVPDSWFINEAHTLVELSHVDGRPRLPYALDVVQRAVRLSWRWNRAVSPELLIALLNPLAASARRSLQCAARSGSSTAGGRTNS